MTLALGVLAALAAAVFYSGGVTLQAIEARSMPESDSLRPSLLRHLVTRKRWLAGTACVVLGWVAQAAALMLAPITIVQPALAVSVVSLLLIGWRFYGQAIQAREVVAALVIMIGVGGLVVASPGHSEGDAAPLALTLGMIVLGLLALAPLLFRGRPQTAGLVALAAGLAYAWTGFSTKFVADGISSGAWLVAGLWLAATVAGAGAGLLSEMSALQTRSAIRVFPVVLVVQIVVAVLLAPLLAGESWSPDPLLVVVLGVSLALVVVATRSLCSATAIEAAISCDDAADGPGGPQQVADGCEGGEGDRADHRQRDGEQEREREPWSDAERGGRGGDEAGRRQRQPGEPVPIVLGRAEPGQAPGTG